MGRMGIGVRKLSRLEIDADKDWAAKKIENLGEPVSPNDAARKIYVDIATTGLGINYYLLDAAAGIDTYKQLSVTPPELAETYVEVTRNAAGDVEIGSWIASADETPVLRLGVYAVHFQAERTSGNIDVRFFFRLYERDTGGSETLINESSLSDLVVSRRDVVVGMVLASDYEMAAGSRLVLKVYVSFLSSGANTTVRLYYQGDVRSRVAIPIAKEILDGLYLPYTGARYDLDLNAKNLSNVGTVDGVDVSAHAANASAHHAKTTDAGEITSGTFDVARIPTHGATKHATTVPYARAGAQNIWVQATQPTAVATGDIWIDTSA